MRMCELRQQSVIMGNLLFNEQDKCKTINKNKHKLV